MRVRELFSMDARNYREDGKVFSRPSARAVILKDGKALLIHSKKYDYYKFPGGGIESGEDHETALCREVLEISFENILPSYSVAMGTDCVDHVIVDAPLP